MLRKIQIIWLKTVFKREKLQNVIKSKEAPNRFLIQRWISEALNDRKDYAELTLRIVDRDESATLNKTYRDKDGPTNVLSFPFEAPPGVPDDNHYLGDLVICAEVVKQEAIDQHKDLTAHWAHMVIHGILHLLGYDHQTKAEAHEMEGIEITILKRLNFKNPYLYSVSP